MVLISAPNLERGSKWRQVHADGLGMHDVRCYYKLGKEVKTVASKYRENDKPNHD